MSSGAAMDRLVERAVSLSRAIHAGSLPLPLPQPSQQLHGPSASASSSAAFRTTTTRTTDRILFPLPDKSHHHDDDRRVKSSSRREIEESLLPPKYEQQQYDAKRVPSSHRPIPAQQSSSIRENNDEDHSAEEAHRHNTNNSSGSHQNASPPTSTTRTSIGVDEHHHHLDHSVISFPGRQLHALIFRDPRRHLQGGVMSTSSSADVDAEDADDIFTNVLTLDASRNHITGWMPSGDSSSSLDDTTTSAMDKEVEGFVSNRGGNLAGGLNHSALPLDRWVSSIRGLKQCFGALAHLDLSYNALTLAPPSEPLHASRHSVADISTSNVSQKVCVLWLEALPPTLRTLDLSHNQLCLVVTGGYVSSPKEKHLQKSIKESSKKSLIGDRGPRFKGCIFRLFLTKLPLLQQLDLSHNTLETNARDVNPNGKQDEDERDENTSSAPVNTTLTVLNLAHMARRRESFEDTVEEDEEGDGEEMVSVNRFFALIPEVIGGLAGLRELYVEHNAIASGGDGISGKVLACCCPQLCDLFIQGNPATATVDGRRRVLADLWHHLPHLQRVDGDVVTDAAIQTFNSQCDDSVNSEDIAAPSGGVEEGSTTTGSAANMSSSSSDVDDDNNENAANANDDDKNDAQQRVMTLLLRGSSHHHHHPQDSPLESISKNVDSSLTQNVPTSNKGSSSVHLTASNVYQENGGDDDDFEEEDEETAAASWTAPEVTLRERELHQLIVAKRRSTAEMQQKLVETKQLVARARHDCAEQLREINALRLAVGQKEQSVKEKKALVVKRKREVRHANVASLRIAEKKVAVAQASISARIDRAERRALGIATMPPPSNNTSTADYRVPHRDENYFRQATGKSFYSLHSHRIQQQQQQHETTTTSAGKQNASTVSTMKTTMTSPPVTRGRDRSVGREDPMFLKPIHASAVNALRNGAHSSKIHSTNAAAVLSSSSPKFSSTLANKNTKPTLTSGNLAKSGTSRKQFYYDPFGAPNLGTPPQKTRERQQEHLAEAHRSALEDDRKGTARHDSLSFATAAADAPAPPTPVETVLDTSLNTSHTTNPAAARERSGSRGRLESGGEAHRQHQLALSRHAAAATLPGHPSDRLADPMRERRSSSTNRRAPPPSDHNSSAATDNATRHEDELHQRDDDFRRTHVSATGGHPSVRPTPYEMASLRQMMQATQESDERDAADASAEQRLLQESRNLLSGLAQSLFDEKRRASAASQKPATEESQSRHQSATVAAKALHRSERHGTLPEYLPSASDRSLSGGGQHNDDYQFTDNTASFTSSAALPTEPLSAHHHHHHTQHPRQDLLSSSTISHAPLEKPVMSSGVPTTNNIAAQPRRIFF